LKNQAIYLGVRRFAPGDPRKFVPRKPHIRRFAPAGKSAGGEYPAFIFTWSAFVRTGTKSVAMRIADANFLYRPAVFHDANGD